MDDSKHFKESNSKLELKALPGPHEFPHNEAEFFKAAGEQGRKKRILVYYIGGITYGEIAAIRFLNKIFKDKKFIIATTQIINGDSCVQMLRGQINNGLTVSSLLAK